MKLFIVNKFTLIYTLVYTIVTGDGFVYCKNCGGMIKKDSKFCHTCGKKVIISEKTAKDEEKVVEVIYCRNCGKQINKNSIKCPECGFFLQQSLSSNDQVENFFIYLVSLFIPFVGILVWMMTKNDNPSRAHTALILSLISTGILFITFLLFIMFVFFFIISGI